MPIITLSINDQMDFGLVHQSNLDAKKGRTSSASSAARNMPFDPARIYVRVDDPSEGLVPSTSRSFFDVMAMKASTLN